MARLSPSRLPHNVEIDDDTSDFDRMMMPRLQISPALRAMLHARHTQRVFWLKRGFAALAFGLMALVLLWPALKGNDFGDAASEIVAQSSQGMVNPTYQGVDRRTNPYSVTADRAQQDANNDSLILLDKPIADFMRAGGQPVNVRATSGNFDQKSNLLDLNGNVTFTDQDGNTFYAQHLGVDFNANSAQSNQPVRAEGSFGNIEGQGVQIENNGDTVIFTGKSRAFLNSTDDREALRAQVPPEQKAAVPVPGKPATFPVLPASSTSMSSTPASSAAPSPATSPVAPPASDAIPAASPNTTSQDKP